MFRRTRLVCVSSIPILIIDIAPAGVRDEHYALRIDLPNDTPVTVVSVNSGQTNSMIPGGAILIDLHVYRCRCETRPTGTSAASAGLSSPKRWRPAERDRSCRRTSTSLRETSRFGSIHG